MKKVLSFALIAILTGMLMCSCAKNSGKDDEEEENTEQEFLNDFKEFVQQVDKLPVDQFDEFDDMYDSFCNKMKRIYGFDHEVDDLDEDDFEKAGIEFSKSQKREFAETMEKLEQIVDKKHEEYKESHRSDYSDYGDYNETYDTDTLVIADAPTESEYDY